MKEFYFYQKFQRVNAINYSDALNLRSSNKISFAPSSQRVVILPEKTGSSVDGKDKACAGFILTSANERILP